MAPRSEQNKVVVLKKTESNRLEDLLFKNTNKNTLTARNERQLEKTFLGRPNRDGKVYSIEDYIPVRKNTVKNQPFVFGLSEKQLNPERNREKLMLYHDFLWKLNYSNGMYIRASDQ